MKTVRSRDGLRISSSSKHRSFRAELKINGGLYLLAIPAIAYFVVFHYVPMPGAYVAFTQFNFIDGIFGSPFVGLENFRFFVESPALARTVRNTLLLNSLGITVGIVLQVGFALLLNELRLLIYKRVSQSIMIFPAFVSWIVVSIILWQFLNFQDGIVNRLLLRLDLDAVNWYQNADAWLFIFVGAHAWKGTGMGTVIYLAAISSIDESLYDAAAIDGANRFQKIWFVTLPSLKPMIIMLTLLAIGRIFTTDVGAIFALIGDNSLLFKWLDTIDYYVLRNLRWNPNLSLTAAVGLIQSVINLMFVLAANFVVRRVYKEGALF